MLTLMLCCSIGGMFAQPGATPAQDRLKGYDQRKWLEQQSVFKSLNPENIGPSIFSCRVTDLDVNPADPTHFYVAYASAGLWYTESNGTDFKPVFDHEAAMTIGDVAVDWQRNIIWVGTGECNSSRSSYAGTGVYKSTDGGKSWIWSGLPESHHISRIVLHPDNPDIAWVAVLGHLYSSNPERGVYKTIDGGKSWKLTLFADAISGAIDLITDPANINTLYAATWERERQAWNFKGAGQGSGIWKSTDGGDNWVKISTADSGFPTGTNAGRIGLTAGQKNGRTILYACIDNQNPKPKKEKDQDESLTKDALRSISKEDFLALDEEKVADYLKKNGFPEKYSTKKVREMVKKGEIQPQALVEYLEDANNNLFDVDYIGAEVYKSEDGGLHWVKTHDKPLDGINFTYGYYFSSIQCMPGNADQVYLLGFYVIRSDDGGKTWKNINGDNVHADHHCIWVNNKRPGHLINGNDGGVNISWDNGTSWVKCNTPPVGQFYAIATDEADPYNVYGGAQDNGVWTGSSRSQASVEWHQSGEYPYKELLGGDGMQIAIDTRDNNTVYTGYQFGNYFRIQKNSGRRDYISPKHDLGERPLRFNWQTPIQLSKHNQDVLYIGANKLYRSLNKGNSWEAISGDLTAGGQKGNVPYGTLSCLHESSLKFGLIYTGSDDGLLYVTKDGGESWKKISDPLPQKLWVSRVQASAHERARVYTTLNGYRWDDFTSYVYMSNDYGATWTRIGLDLPAEPVNVLREDPVNPDILYVGTDHNFYVSVDRGVHFYPFSSDFPDVPVHDLALQAKTNELVIGTHGRSMFRIHVGELQQLTTEVLAETVYLFDIRKKRYQQSWGKELAWKETTDPEFTTSFYCKEEGKIRWVLKTKDGLELNKGEQPCAKGMNSLTFVPSVKEDVLKKYTKAVNEAQKDAKKPIEIKKADTGKYYIYKGVFLLELEKDGKTVSKEMLVE